MLLVQKNRAGAQQRWAALRRVSRGPIGCRRLSVVETYTPTAQENQAPGAVGQLLLQLWAPRLARNPGGLWCKKGESHPASPQCGQRDGRVDRWRTLYRSSLAHWCEQSGW